MTRAKGLRGDQAEESREGTTSAWPIPTFETKSLGAVHPGLFALAVVAEECGFARLLKLYSDWSD